MNRKFSYFLISLLIAFALRAHAQPSTTHITDTVYRADGTPAHGSLNITWPAFTTAGGQAVAAGTMNVPIGVNGALSLQLVPNEGATPSGTFYKVLIRLDDGTQNTEFWTVPAASPTTVAAIRSSVMPATVAAQFASVQYVQQAIAAAVGNGNGGSDGCLNVSSYGAKGDLTHDDTAAVQQWINAIPDGGCGLIPPNFKMAVHDVIIDQRADLTMFVANELPNAGTRAGFYYNGAGGGRTIYEHCSRVHWSGVTFSAFVPGSTHNAAVVREVDGPGAGTCSFISTRSTAEHSLFVAQDPSTTLERYSWTSTTNVEDMADLDNTYFCNGAEGIVIGPSANAKNYRFARIDITGCAHAIHQYNGDFSLEDVEFSSNTVDVQIENATGPISLKHVFSEDAGQHIVACAQGDCTGGHGVLHGNITIQDDHPSQVSSRLALAKPWMDLQIDHATLMDVAWDFPGQGVIGADVSQPFNFTNQTQVVALNINPCTTAHCVDLSSSWATAGAVTRDGHVLGSLKNFNNIFGDRYSATLQSGLVRPVAGVDENADEDNGGFPAAACATDSNLCFGQGELEIQSVPSTELGCVLHGSDSGGGVQRFAIVPRDASGNRALSRYMYCATPLTYTVSNYVGLSAIAPPGAASYDWLWLDLAGGTGWHRIANTAGPTYNVTAAPSSGLPASTLPSWNETAVIKLRGQLQMAQGSLPAPSAVALGGIKAQDCGSQFAQKINTDGSVTCAAGGTVTSVGLSLPPIFSVSGSPVTSGGTLSASLTSQNANTIFAGPASGAAAAPGFRALAKQDLPALACADLTNAAASCSTDATNAANITTGALAAARLPVFVASGALHAAGAVPDPGATAGTAKFLREDAAWQQVTDANLSVTDVTTNNVSTAAHGFVPKAPSDTTKFLRGDGTWAAPASGGSVTSYVNTTSATCDANASCTTDTNLQSVTINANDLGSGVPFHYAIAGVWTNSAGSPNLTVKVKAGSTVLLTCTYNNGGSTTTNGTWQISGQLIPTAAAGASVATVATGDMTLHFSGTPSGSPIVGCTGNASTVNLATNASITFQDSASWQSTTTGTNTFISQALVAWK